MENGSMVFCCGNHENGQLGLGGIENDKVPVFSEIKHLNGKPVQCVSCGDDHSLVLLEDGIIYSFGDNDSGQLGHDKPRRRPEQITALENQFISLIACGGHHSVAVTDTGQVFSWGDNSCGQLGRGFTDDTFSVRPKLVKHLSDHRIVQISCSRDSNICLSADGSIFTWGLNNSGQLGLGHTLNHGVPVLLTSLASLPIQLVGSGAHHQFALTCSGSLYLWGKNNFGQLGTGDETNSTFPVLCKTLRTQPIAYVAAGESHTAVLTLEGGVFTFGAGMYGQLGHNSTSNEPLPRKVFELMGTEISQISCGRNHTMAFSSCNNRLYSFGLGAKGQLGLCGFDRRLNPVLVPSFWSGSCEPRSPEPAQSLLLALSRTYAGGDCSMIYLQNKYNSKTHVPADYRCRSNSKLSFCLSEETTNELASYTAGVKPPVDVEEIISRTFTLSCLNGSFLTCKNSHYNCSKSNHGVDMDLSANVFAKLSKLPNHHIMKWVQSAIKSQVIDLLPRSPPGVESLRVFLFLPSCHLFGQYQDFASIITPFAKAICSLDSIPLKILDHWFSLLSTTHFNRYVKVFSQTVSHILCLSLTTSNMEVLQRKHHIHACLRVLKILNKINEVKQIIAYEDFYINLENKVDIRDEYIKWSRDKDQGDPFLFCDFPFIFDAQTKTCLLHTDALFQMQQAAAQAHQENLSRIFLQPQFHPVNPCLLLIVRRLHIAQDTIQQLDKHNDSDLRKPLKVVFDGEEAIDEGGVTKEFFMLLIRDVLDPKYGMFKYYEESRLLWFNSITFETDKLYKLIGQICALAVYNGTIVDLSFPFALFKLLLDRKVVLDDLFELDPPVARSLKQLLSYEKDDIEESFCLNFTVTSSNFGVIETIELKPGGEEVPVTKENRQEYVDLYLNYIFLKSVQSQIKEFYEGFHRILDGKILEIFQPKELQAMIVGNENYDWFALEQNCHYKPEFHAKHPTIVMFWNIFHTRLTLDQKKQFLTFLTGSYRIPIHGMQVLKMAIQPTMGGEAYLPVAHTCFNLLDLPVYKDEDNFHQKLLQAISQSEGFALV